MLIRTFKDFVLCAAIIVSPFLTSCKGSEEELDVNLAVKANVSEVASTAGSTFVTVTASGSWSLAISAKSGLTSDWASLSTTSGTGTKSNVVLTYSANPDTLDRAIILTVTSGKNTSGFTFTQKALDNGSHGGGGDDGGGGSSSTTSGWLELPATSSTDGLDFFTHSMTIGSVTTRNYSFYWDYDNLVAHWVAYPLNAWSIGSSVSRTDAWGLDPLLPQSKQPVLYSAFASGNNGWYARGHQCPSADRLTSYAANSMTFYFTNMTPQIQDNFNGGIWSDLESMVRSWSRSSDTLYVVTGCTTKGSKYYALDNYGKKVTVPTGYYKAVLRYSRNSTIGFSSFIACAVYLEHKQYTGDSIKTHAMSIDDLETLTGEDFFVNLPAKVGADDAAKIEAQDPKQVNWWW
jgi:endonuclease G